MTVSKTVRMAVSKGVWMAGSIDGSMAVEILRIHNLHILRDILLLEPIFFLILWLADLGAK
jgi:hypothetical protein